MMMFAAMMLAMAADPAPDCRNPPSQIDLNRCEGLRFEAEDRAMNKQWKTTLAILRKADAEPRNDGRPGYADQLLKAQRAWLAYRDEHCRSDGYRMRGGSAESMLISGCKAELTKERTKQLADLSEEL